jgi:malonyl-CoA/methylmalonyl-CoA synthetase
VGLVVGEQGAAPDLEAISASIGASLARFKQPKKLILVPELPRNTMGKVQKNALRAQYGGLFAG